MESVGLLWKVLWAPGEAMFRISKRPRVLVPLILLSLFSGGTAALMAFKVDQGELTIRMIERTSGVGQLTDELRDRIKEQANNPAQVAGRYAASMVYPSAFVAFVALIYFGLFTVLGRTAGYKTFLAITAFACIPFIFRQLASMLTLFVVPESSIMIDELGSISPSVFLDRDAVSPVLFAAISMVDIITIWILSLLVIGFRFVAEKGVPVVTRAVAVVGVYMVYALGRLGVAYIFGV